jgi:hypothetical protein
MDKAGLDESRFFIEITINQPNQAWELRAPKSVFAQSVLHDKNRLAKTSQVTKNTSRKSFILVSMYLIYIGKLSVPKNGHFMKNTIKMFIKLSF